MVQWILLAAVIVVVGGAYWYLRRHNGNDPWQGMEDDRSDEDIATRGEALGGDSYIVGVRTLSSSAPNQPNDDPNQGVTSDADAAAAWETYKKPFETAPAPSQDSKPVTPARPQQDQAEQPEPPKPTTSVRMDNIRPVQPPAGEEKIFVLHVASAEGMAFDGPDIHAALNAEGLKFGLNDFYHRVTDANGVIESVYCIANMLKPGALDPVEQDHLRTPGLTLFLILPGAIEGSRAMRDMMETANGIAEHLGGQVLDDQRNLLKAQSAQYILDQIAELDRQARLRAAR